METDKYKNRRKLLLLIINCVLLAIGICGGPILVRLYFIGGGKRIWFSAFLQNAAWPITAVVLAVSYSLRRRHNGRTARLFSMTPKVFYATVTLGIIGGTNTFLYSYGMARLPVSTAILLINSAQLAFTACFAFLFVKQNFTVYSVNAVVLLTMSAAVLVVGKGGDRPAKESSGEYVIGFVMALLVAVLDGLLLPGIELVYKMAKQTVTYTLVLEIQMVMCFAASVFCIIGMIINKDFQAIRREAKEFGMGEGKYYVVVISTPILWQMFSIGAVGVIWFGSSVFSGVIVAMCVSVTEVLGVIFYGERFSAGKGISLALSLWGFVSYFYGEVVKNNNGNKNDNNHDVDNLTELNQNHSLTL